MKPWHHISPASPSEKLRERGLGRVGFKEGVGKTFLLEKNIALSVRKARFMCCEKGAWAVTWTAKYLINSIYFLAFQRAGSNRTSWLHGASSSASALRSCSLSSAFQNMQWMLQELHIYPFGTILLQGQISTLKKIFKNSKTTDNDNNQHQHHWAFKYYNSPSSTDLVYSHDCFCLISAHELLCSSQKEHPSVAQHTILNISNPLQLRFIYFMSWKPYYLCVFSLRI